MAEIELGDELRRAQIKSWHHYLIALDPLRPQLFRYCRELTGNPWDAEDLVQETLLKVFASLSQTMYTLRNPKAYLVRMATHSWIDRLRTRAVERAAEAAGKTEAAVHGHSRDTRPDESSQIRDAAAELMQRLAPQERAAFLMVEIFETTLEETAGILGTTVGATKAALHRGRERLKDAESLPPRRARPAPQVLDAFVSRYNARDLPGLLALMRDDAEIRMHGFHTEVGREGFERKGGWFHHNFYSPVDGSPSKARWERAEVDGEPVILVFGGVVGDESLQSVMRIEETVGSVSRIFVYALCPDVVREVGERLGIPSQSWGYRFPFDVSGQ